MEEDKEKPFSEYSLKEVMEHPGVIRVTFQPRDGVVPGKFNGPGYECMITNIYGERFWSDCPEGSSTEKMLEEAFTAFMYWYEK